MSNRTSSSGVDDKSAKRIGDVAQVLSRLNGLEADFLRVRELAGHLEAMELHYNAALERAKDSLGQVLADMTTLDAQASLAEVRANEAGAHAQEAARHAATVTAMAQERLDQLEAQVKASKIDVLQQMEAWQTSAASALAQRQTRIEEALAARGSVLDKLADAVKLDTDAARKLAKQTLSAQREFEQRIGLRFSQLSQTLEESDRNWKESERQLREELVASLATHSETEEALAARVKRANRLTIGMACMFFALILVVATFALVFR